jgi:hypothetical protein
VIYVFSMDLQSFEKPYDVPLLKFESANWAYKQPVENLYRMSTTDYQTIEIFDPLEGIVKMN